MTSDPPDQSDIVTEQGMATSHDGTPIPISIVRQRDYHLDGNAPALLSGYGAYGVTTTPTYNPFLLTWVRNGGVYATCHVRGGGARGEAWHLGGIKEKKENGVDDYIACAEFLIEKGYTRTGRLTAHGISAGGIVVGGAITKKPGLFAAAVLRVPIVNPLRFETTQAGPGNAPEFGTVKIESECRSLLASDPLHRVRENSRYPATLLTAGKNDPRVPVWQPAKFAARLQEVNGSTPTLLRVDTDAGHGVGSTESQREDEFADIFAFALWQSKVRLQ